ncbi:MAG: MFS transporter [Candidatus Obscuribacter sp.]|nr:MFS transporter [Candidatus Obscuribacter sp.]
MSQTPPDPSQSGPQVALPGAKAAMALLLGINLFNYIDRQVLSAVVPQIKESLLAYQDHASPVVAFLLKVLGTMLGGNAENTMVSLLSMAFLVSYIIAAPLLSSLPVKRWWIICGGVIIWSLASGGSGMATGFGILLLTRCLVGIGEAAYGPVAPSILADYFPVASRGKALSWFYLAIPVGSALGFVLGGLVGSTLGWQWAFYVVVPPGIILGLLCLLMKDPRVPPKQSLAREQSRMTQYRGFLKNRSFVLNTLAMTLMTFAIGGMAFWMPTYIHEYRNAGSLASVNIIFGAILVLSGLTATLLGGYLGRQARAAVQGLLLPCLRLGDGAGLSCLPGHRLRALPHCLDPRVPGMLLPVLQHRSKQHSTGQCDRAFVASQCLCPQHPDHPPLWRCALAARHRRHH